ncbi:glycerophosphodiester phosphodiesterase [Rhizobium miluonense]|uniref:Glycerophosphoryl diester phosphodiesterase n=1 Tax=Rhizobium miluonense TaxID=411945 RepID=A0A1C3WE03_9HYPH|nr:glycerophosphodiester phosphodiesterase family protein [Rhizobium miluonense]SCB38213.1 glycerophosphoryl diester phosphodiesterase [Rhizobium miluonense]
MSLWNRTRLASLRRPLVIGHRGTPTIALENTRESFRRAIAGGADAVETDVHLTADGHIVCLHDDNLLRVAGVSASIGQLTFDEARSHLPSLLRFSDFLDLTRGFPVIVDVKHASAADLDAFIAQVIKRDALSRSLFSAYTPEIARNIRQRSSEATIGTFFPEGGDCLHSAKRIGASFIRVLPHDYTHQKIASIREAGFGTIAVAAPLSSFKTASDSQALRQIADLQIDSVITDTPELASAEYGRAR